MGTVENKAIALRYLEESHNRYNLAIIDELCGPEYAAQQKEWLPAELAAFPDKHFTVEDVVAEGETVAVWWTFRGTQRGPFWTPVGTVAATGRSVTFPGLFAYRFEAGKIMEDRLSVDWLEVLRQLGATVRLPGMDEQTIGP